MKVLAIIQLNEEDKVEYKIVQDNMKPFVEGAMNKDLIDFFDKVEEMMDDVADNYPEPLTKEQLQAIRNYGKKKISG